MSSASAVPCLVAVAALSNACTGPATSAPALADGWTTVLDSEFLDGAVLSVFGTPGGDIFAVGGGLGTGTESLVAFHDGTRWRRLFPEGTETYWWGSASADDDVWIVGEHGRITHWNGREFQDHAPLVDVTLWGTFSRGPGDAWAVGGSPGMGTEAPNEVVLHWNGAAWSRVALPGPARGVAFFKVWGDSFGGLWVVGELGTVWRCTPAGEWLHMLPIGNPSLAADTLLTVHGCAADDVWAVGGQAILHHDGVTWRREDVAGAGNLNGVHCGGRGEVLIVGFGGARWHRVGNRWIDESRDFTLPDLHAAWRDSRGAWWAAGGDWLLPLQPGARRLGVLARLAP